MKLWKLFVKLLSRKGKPAPEKLTAPRELSVVTVPGLDVSLLKGGRTSDVVQLSSDEDVIFLEQTQKNFHADIIEKSEHRHDAVRVELYRRLGRAFPGTTLSEVVVEFLGGVGMDGMFCDFRGQYLEIDVGVINWAISVARTVIQDMTCPADGSLELSVKINEALAVHVSTQIVAEGSGAVMERVFCGICAWKLFEQVKP